MPGPSLYEREAALIIKEFLTQRKATLEIRAAGSSMRPLIKEGDILVVKSVAPQKLRRGDIAVFDLGKQLCAHRLIKKNFCANRWVFLAKSDKTFYADTPFSEQDLLGRVSCIQRGRRRINLDAKFWVFANSASGLCHSFLYSLKNWGRFYFSKK